MDLILFGDLRAWVDGVTLSAVLGGCVASFMAHGATTMVAQ